MIDEIEILRRLLGRADPARDLEADPALGLLDHREQDRGRLEGGADRALAGRGLEHVGAGHDRRARRSGDPGRLVEPPGLEDHFQDALRRLGPTGLHELGDEAEVAVQDRLDRRHHVDLVGAGRKRVGGLARRAGEVVRAVREVGDGRQTDRAVAELGPRDRHETRPYADRGDAGVERALAQRGDGCGAVVVAERGQIEQRQNPGRRLVGGGRGRRAPEQIRWRAHRHEPDPRADRAAGVRASPPRRLPGSGFPRG